MGKQVQQIAVSQLKAELLAIVEKIATTGVEVVITKRGKTVAKLVPFSDDVQKPVAGKLSGTILFEDDIVSPLGSDLWDSAK